jgi:hypothetical protein
VKLLSAQKEPTNAGGWPEVGVFAAKETTWAAGLVRVGVGAEHDLRPNPGRDRKEGSAFGRGVTVRARGAELLRAAVNGKCFRPRRYGQGPV